MERILSSGLSVQPAQAASGRPLKYAAIGLALATSLLAGCATNNPQDPLEPYNRAMFKINQNVDKAVLKPVATGYKDVVPIPMRKGVTNFFGNLGDVWSMANDFAQGHVVEGLNGFMRVGVNTVFGVLGVLDISSEMGLYKQPNDFGLTLARYGIGSSPYFVIPLLGPSTIRDAAGTGVAIYYAPFNYTTNNAAVRNSAAVLQLVNTRANMLSTTALLEQIALDPYVFTRDAFMQQRKSQVKAVRSEGILSPGPLDSGGNYSDADAAGDVSDTMDSGAQAQPAPAPAPAISPANTPQQAPSSPAAPSVSPTASPAASAARP
ncbi:MAG: MlaA family lipoprotein [Thiomonas sp.]